MFNHIISKRTSVLMALLMLAVGLLVVSTNSAYADNFEDPVDLPFVDDFGLPKHYTGKDAGNDVPRWSEIEGQDDDCAVKNAHAADMALQLTMNCDAYVTFDIEGADSFYLAYDWGYHTTGDSADAGTLEVYYKVIAPGVETPVAIVTHSLLPQTIMRPADYFPWTREEDPIGVEGTTYTVEVHFKGTSTSDSDWAWVDNVNIYSGLDYLPDGGFSYSQGYYGSGHEHHTCEILAWMALNSEVDLRQIRDILEALPGISAEDIDTHLELCLFLVGTVGNTGGNNDGGFLPAGKVDGYDSNNLAAQEITLLLNLNLYVILIPDEYPIELYYFLNIDPVLDYVDGFQTRWYDPILTTSGDESLGTCTDSEPNFKCDDGTVVLSLFGEQVQLLDDAGTTVWDMELAAMFLLENPLEDDRLVNGVLLTRIDVTNIMSLINKSYDVGVPTAFVIYPNNND